MLIDSHCHLNIIPHQTPEAVIAQAQAEGVQHFLCVAIDLETFPTVLTLAQRFASVFASAGVHPNVAAEVTVDVAQLTTLANHPRVIAIGETGLDYFRSQGAGQQQRFRTHIQAARALGKPLIVHSREAAEDTLRILEEENAAEVGGVMHCFVDDWPTAQRALELGFYISFSGIITFKNAESLRQVAQQVPLDRILVETDSPYLAPVPYRGKTNQPAYVKYVAELIAKLRGESLESIAQITTTNFFRLFSADAPHRA
ncbi:MAG: TatD family hydrolase [Pseudomonadota bacterium]|nr:TatD family hydrolase [Pseudomonadota bacterium]